MRLRPEPGLTALPCPTTSSSHALGDRLSARQEPRMTVSPRSLSGGDVTGEARRYAPLRAEPHPTPEASRLSGFPLRSLTTKHKKMKPRSRLTEEKEVSSIRYG